MFRVVLIVVPLGLLATVTLRPTIVTHLPSVVVDLLLALIIVWPILVIRSLRRSHDVLSRLTGGEERSRTPGATSDTDHL